MMLGLFLGESDLAAEVVAPKVPLPESQVQELEHARLTTEVQQVEQVEFAVLAALADFQEMERIELAALAAAQAARRRGAPPSGVPGPEPKVPLPESSHDIEEVIRQEIKDNTTDVPIRMPSSSIVPAVPAGQTSVPNTSRVLQPQSSLANQGVNQCRVFFESTIHREIAFNVFSRMLAAEATPFVGSPDLRRGTMDTATNPVWLLFGWDNTRASFMDTYGVQDNPNHGDHGF